MNKILNLTQHDASLEQIAEGVVEPTDKAWVQKLLTFEEIPMPHEVWERACQLADITEAGGFTKAMIGGAPYFTGVLEQTLHERNIYPMYSFTKRDSVDMKQPDGTTLKKQIFRHAGWVAPPLVSEI